MSAALARTRYLVTAKDGRIGKSRQVQPFEIEVKALPHDLDRIRDETCRVISRFAKTKGLDIVLFLPEGTSALYANVYSSLSNTPIGALKFEQLEEDDAE